jgi:hypothetical protein
VQIKWGVPPPPPPPPNFSKKIKEYIKIFLYRFILFYYIWF